MKLNRSIPYFATAIAVIFLAPSMASADPLHREDRTGLTIGVGAGMGHLECAGEYCNGVTEAGGLDVHLGLRLIPELAVVGELWAMAHTEDRLTVSQGIATIGPKVWPIERLWFRLGLGVARASYNYDAGIVDLMDSTEWVPAAMTAVGFEFLSNQDFAMDVQLRAGTGFFNEGDTEVRNLSLGVGASWF